MNIWDRRAAQAKNEESGITVRVTEYPGFSFRLRPLCDWNDEYLRARVAIAFRPDVADFLKRTAAPKYEMTTQDKLFDKALEREVFARGCVISWDGIPAPDGSGDFPFTAENAVTLFGHFPEIYTTLRREAADIKNFWPKDADTIAGNSKRVSRSKSAAGAS